MRFGKEIELENRECCGLQRLGLVGSGRSWVGLGAVLLGMEIELENMARHAGFWWALVLSGSLGSGTVRLGKYRHGVEIELENMER